MKYSKYKIDDTIPQYFTINPLHKQDASREGRPPLRRLIGRMWNNLARR